MTKKERILAAVRGENCDRQPYAIWTHLPGIDMDPVKLAEKTYEFYKEYDTDLIKTMNNGMYSIEDFGCEIDYSGIEKGGVAKLISTPVKEPEDWDRIEKPDFADCRALNRELTSLKLLLDKVKEEEVPVIFTVFSPLTTADKLSGGQVLKHIAEGHGEKIHRVLNILTELTEELVRRANDLGADGIYFATQMSSFDITTEEIYREYGTAYDLRVLNASKGSCDALHCHGVNIMYDLLKEYPVDIFNWHAGETSPDFETAAQMDRCLMGGIVRNDITESNYEAIRSQIEKSYMVMKGRHHILSAGCVIRYPLNPKALAYVKKCADEICVPE